MAPAPSERVNTWSYGGVSHLIIFSLSLSLSLIAIRSSDFLIGFLAFADRRILASAHYIFTCNVWPAWACKSFDHRHQHELYRRVCIRLCFSSGCTRSIDIKEYISDMYGFISYYLYLNILRVKLYGAKTPGSFIEDSPPSRVAILLLDCCVDSIWKWNERENYPRNSKPRIFRTLSSSIIMLLYFLSLLLYISMAFRWEHVRINDDIKDTPFWNEKKRNILIIFIPLRLIAREVVVPPPNINAHHKSC